MTEKRLYVGTPCYGGMVSNHYMTSVVGLQLLCMQEKIPFQLFTMGNESLVTRARNRIVHRFLKSDATHLLFVDADIRFQPKDVLKLLSHDLDVVAGAYPKKQIVWDKVRAAAEAREPNLEIHATDLAINLMPHAEGDRVIMENGLVEVLDAPTGFMLLSRKAILDVIKAHPETMYLSDTPSEREPMHAIFDCFIDERKRYLSEDYGFCRRWQKLGGTIYVDIDVKLAHAGSFVFHGDPLTLFVQRDDEEGEFCDPPSMPDSNHVKHLHIERYEWANERIKGRVVANAACGTGYGSTILEKTGRVVIGFDRDPKALELARSRGLATEADIGATRFSGFDTLVSLETLEHLDDAWGWLRNLSTDVTELVLSTPIIPTTHKNRFHKHDFTIDGVLTGMKCLGWDVVEHRIQCHDVILVHARRPPAMAPDDVMRTTLQRVRDEVMNKRAEQVELAS